MRVSRPEGTCALRGHAEDLLHLFQLLTGNLPERIATSEDVAQRLLLRPTGHCRRMCVGRVIHCVHHHAAHHSRILSAWLIAGDLYGFSHVDLAVFHAPKPAWLGGVSLSRCISSHYQRDISVSGSSVFRPATDQPTAPHDRGAIAVSGSSVSRPATDQPTAP